MRQHIFSAGIIRFVSMGCFDVHARGRLLSKAVQIEALAATCTRAAYRCERKQDYRPGSNECFLHEGVPFNCGLALSETKHLLASVHPLLAVVKGQMNAACRWTPVRSDPVVRS
jgi:hypothetical protein